MIVFTMFKAYADDDSMIYILYYPASAGLHAFHLQAYLPNPASTKTPWGKA